MFQTLSTPPGEPWVADSTQREVREVPKDREKKDLWPRRTSLLSQRMTTRWDKGPMTGLRYHRAGWLHASTTWKKQMFLFFFRLEATVLINNLSDTTTNPRVNAENTSLFPSLSFYHKHINISLTRVLRCTARPAGSQQAASTLCAQKAMLKCEALSCSYRHR